MIDPAEAARILARERGDSIVVPHPFVERYWSEASGSPDRDVPPPQSDGEEAAFALGLAMARPDKRIVVLDVDEALLSNLGALVTISDATPQNLVHVLFQRGIRSGAAGLPLPGGTRTDFAAIARGAGYRNACTFDDIEELDGELNDLLALPGPTMVVIKTNPYALGESPESPSLRYDMSDDVRDYRDRLDAD